jgi:hypothetical protein
MDFDRGPDFQTVLLIGLGAFAVLLAGSCCCTIAFVPFLSQGVRRPLR